MVRVMNSFRVLVRVYAKPFCFTGPRSACHSAKSLNLILFMNIIAWGPQVSFVRLQNHKNQSHAKFWASEFV